MSSTLTPAQRRARNALEEHRFFKLICGGSFTDADKVSALTHIYSHASIDCIDIAPDMGVLRAVEQGLQAIAEPPMVMVSIPLDPDPHFRKIELSEADCILCDACIPVCPTDALDHVTTPNLDTLTIDQPLCYGCGRCTDICPTRALSLNPFEQNPDELQQVLSNPVVDAVEIHTRHADPYMLFPFLSQHHAVLRNKAVALCFRPNTVAVEQWQRFLSDLQTFVATVTPEFPLIIQVDGEPMSGSVDAESSLPALKSAAAFKHITGDQFPYITISGGINRETAAYLQMPEYHFIAGAGMGTIARQTVWGGIGKENDEQSAMALAQALVSPFKSRPKSVIMETSTDEEGFPVTA